MHTEDFTARVRQACPELDPPAAHNVVMITVHTICEHLTPEQAGRIADRLPDELQQAARDGGREQSRNDTPIAPREFYEQLLARGEVGHETAERVARVVAKSLQEVMNHSENRAATSDLPQDIDKLIDDSG